MTTRKTIALLSLATVAVSASPLAADAGVVISGVYGGGGSTTTGGTYKQDYVELFNTGTVAQSLSGWSIQYASATSTAVGASNVFALPPITLQPGQYYLVQNATLPTYLGNDLNAYITPDASCSLALSAANGKVAVANSTTPASWLLPPTLLSIQDLVAYGTTNAWEGSKPANNGVNLDKSKGIARKNSGRQDTNDNNADFTLLTYAGTGAAAANFIPSNSASARNLPTSAALGLNIGDGGTLAFGNVRLGTPAVTLPVIAQNAGTISTLTGTFGAASGAFTAAAAPDSFSLDQNVALGRNYTFAPTGHGVASSPVTITSNAGNATITLSGSGVGPTFAASIASVPASIIDFGTLDLTATGSASLTLDLKNDTADTAPDALLDLTLLAVSTPDAPFGIAGFTPGTVIHKAGTSSYTLSFTPTTVGEFSTTLTFTTDQNAALGSAGQTFSYTLQGNAIIPVPEPASLSLLGIAAGALLLTRRRRA